MGKYSYAIWLWNYVKDLLEYQKFLESRIGYGNPDRTILQILYSYECPFYKCDLPLDTLMLMYRKSLCEYESCILESSVSYFL